MDEETTPEVEEETQETEVPTEDTNDQTNDDNDEAVEDDTPAPDSEGEPEEEDEPLYQPRQYQPEPLDFSKLPTDENGNVDPNAFAQALQQRDQNLLQAAQQQMQDQFVQMRQEETLWQKAEKAYPEIAQNPELRALVQNTRYGIIAGGKNASPLEAAKQIFKHTQAAKQQGQAQAKESVRMQRSAALESSSTQASPKSNTSGLMDKISSSNRAEAESARQALLESWLNDGTLKAR